jgi:hypothetical protein
MIFTDILATLGVILEALFVLTSYYIIWDEHRFQRYGKSLILWWGLLITFAIAVRTLRLFHLLEPLQGEIIIGVGIVIPLIAFWIGVYTRDHYDKRN